jgi:hypothetical protein
VQDGFAVRCSLDSSRDEDDTTFTFTLTDGADGPDAYLAGRTAETEIAAATDVLLAVIANVDGNGRVEVDGDGTLEMEVLSIISRSAVDSDTHDYEVLRARKGTAARSWTTDAKVWIIPGADLEAWVHEDMLALLNSGDIGYVQLSTITGYAEDDESLPQFSFVFPGEFKLAPQITWGEPETNPYTLGSSGDLDPTATIDDADGNLVRVELFSVRDDTNLLTKHLDVPFPPTMQQTLGNCFDLANVSGTVNFPGQVSVDTYHTLTLRATDSSGNVIEASVTLIRPATGGGGAGVGGVTYSPTAAESDPPTLVTLTVGGSADRIHYKLDLIGSSAPSSFSTEMDTSVQVSIPSSKRLWARASNGSNHSAWQHQDYQQDFGL